MKRTWPRPLRWVTVIVLVSGCAHGITTPASSPDAFSLAPGTKVTLHLRSGEDITGEYCDQNESSVTLDSGSIRVLKTLVASVTDEASVVRHHRHTREDKAQRAGRGSKLWMIPVVLAGIAVIVGISAMVILGGGVGLIGH